MVGEGDVFGKIGTVVFPRCYLVQNSLFFWGSRMEVFFVLHGFWNRILYLDIFFILVRTI